MQGRAGQGCCSTQLARGPLLQHLQQSTPQNMEASQAQPYYWQRIFTILHMSSSSGGAVQQWSMR
eukprot:203062-Heterocapsa_arctica.AAC.1